MGVKIENTGNSVLIHGNGLHGLRAPDTVLDAGNSGTTTRLISGILAGQNFTCELTGDASIQKRPMGRILKPLKLMGAEISSQNGNDCAPLTISGRALHGIHYQSPVASAQVKSCILLAGLYADDKTSVTEPYLSRNHTGTDAVPFRRGHRLRRDDSLDFARSAPSRLQDQCPGDISSAAYFIAAALIIPGSEVLIKMSASTQRESGILRVCHEMGADIELLNKRSEGGEPAADLLVRAAS